MMETGLNEFQGKWGDAVRLPTRFEAARVGRLEDGEDTAVGDAVLELQGADTALQIVAAALGEAGYCDAAHVIPGIGVYLEE